MESYFRTISYALIGAAFVGLALTGEVDAPSLSLYALLFAVSYYADVRNLTRWRPSEVLWRVIAILYIPLFAADAMLVSGRVLALVHLTLFLSAAKLLQIKRDRDWVFLYLLAFFQMLLSAGLTFNAIFIASLTLFLFVFISALAAFEIRRARQEVKSSSEEIILSNTEVRPNKPRRNPVSELGGRKRYLFGASLAQMLIVGALTLPLFFLIPRLGGGGVAQGFGESAALTGFSETVELGKVAAIKKNQRIIMRVQLAGNPGRRLRWRGIALDHYENDTWKVFRDKDGKRTSILTSGSVGTPRVDYSFKIGSGQSSPRNPVEQTIVLEKNKARSLFAAYKPVSIKGPFSDVAYDQHSLAITSDDIHRRVTYSVLSDVSRPSEEELRRELSPDGRPPNLRPEIETFFLQKPKNLDPRIRQLALEWTAGKGSDYDKARAIEEQLKAFSYSLDLKPAKSDPLAEFLFETREGHCEYFATAMTILLRTLNIPARLVNGFQMGEYNDINSSYVVRESDAHSWVEVYFAHLDAWVEFDPTPPAGINNYSNVGILGTVRKYVEALESFWLDYVVTLDSDEQASIMVTIQNELRDAKDAVRAYYLAFTTWMKEVTAAFLLDRQWNVGAILKLIGIVLGFVLLWLTAYILTAHRKRRHLAPTGYGPWWHRLFIVPRWRRAPDEQSGASAVLFYEAMLAITARGGLLKPPHQTPNEFAAQTGFDQVRQITEIYNQVRFGGARLNRQQIAQVSGLLRQLKQAIKQLRAQSRRRLLLSSLLPKRRNRTGAV